MWFLSKAKKKSLSLLGRASVNFTMRRLPDGSWYAKGNMDLSGMGLTKLPDLSNVYLEGNFYCQDNQLSSLKGAPRCVTGNFWCHNNQIASLREGPESVGGSYFCNKNRLTSLECAAQETGAFHCDENMLTTLKGAPKSVRDSFFCDGNKLTSLEHAPESVGATFGCSRNPLTSLAEGPKKFKRLSCDMGDFFGWDSIPPALRGLAPEPEAAPVVKVIVKRKPVFNL